MKLLENKKLKKQNQNIKSYFKQRSKKDGKIFWNNMNKTQVFNLVRAVTRPYPGAFCIDKNGNEVIIFKCAPSNNKLNDQKIGKVVIKNKFPEVRCKKGSVKIIKSSRKLINNEILK